MAHNRDYKPEDIAFPNQVITESELVGEMEDNGQMLCPDCNREKSNSVEFMAKRLLFKPVHKG